MRRKPQRCPDSSVWIGSLRQQLWVLLVAAFAAQYAGSETKVLSTKAAAAVKIKTPAAVKVKTPAAVKVKAPPAAKIHEPTAVKVKAPAAEDQTPSTVKVKVPAAPKAATAAKVKAPAAAKAEAPQAVKVKAPAAAKVKASTAAKVKVPASAKPEAPSAVKVKAPAAANVQADAAAKVKVGAAHSKVEEPPAMAVVTANGEVLHTQAPGRPPPAVKVKPKQSSGSAAMPNQPSHAPPVVKVPPAVKVKANQPSTSAAEPKEPYHAPPVVKVLPAPLKVHPKQPSASSARPKQPSQAPPVVKVPPGEVKVQPKQPSASKVTPIGPSSPPPVMKVSPAAVKVTPTHPSASAAASHQPSPTPPVVKVHSPAVKVQSKKPTASAATPKQSSQAPPAAHSLPFAATAWHTSGLDDLLACTANDVVERGGASSPCFAGRSLQRGWQYAVNNLLLSLRYAGSAARTQLAAGLGADLAKVVPALKEFDAAAGASTALATSAVAAAAAAVAAAFRQVFSESRREWLASLPAAGTNFSGTFRSVKLPVEEHGIVDVGRVLVKLKSGFSMPMLGFGSQASVGPLLRDDVQSALEAGCRHLVIPAGLPSELAVGEALQRFLSKGSAREQLFLTLRPGSVSWDRPSAVAVTLEAQLKALRVDYVDLYLLPGPGPSPQATARLWEAYEALISSGQSRSIGVANFTARELEALLKTAKVQPHVIQTTYSIYAPGPGSWEMQDKDVLDQVARPTGMMMLADGVLSGGPALLEPLDDPHVRAIAKVHSRSSSEVLLRWAMQRGMAVVLDNTSKSHAEESAGAFTFELSEYEMAVLSHLAVLTETTPWPGPGSRHRPPWKADVFALMRAAATLEPLLATSRAKAAQAA